MGAMLAGAGSDPTDAELRLLACDHFRHEAFSLETIKKLVEWLQVKHGMKPAEALFCQRARVVSLLRAAANPVSDQTGAGDPDAYVPAGKLWPEKFDTYRKFQTWLHRNPLIRTRKPSKYRLLIHAGDWANHPLNNAAASLERLDVDQVSPEMAAAVEARKASIPKKTRRVTNKATDILKESLSTDA